MSIKGRQKDATDEDISSEFAHIQEAWKSLRQLDNPARFRALDWLTSLVRNEAGSDNGNGDYC